MDTAAFVGASNKDDDGIVLPALEIAIASVPVATKAIKDELNPHTSNQVHLVQQHVAKSDQLGDKDEVDGETNDVQDAHVDIETAAHALVTSVLGDTHPINYTSSPSNVVNTATITAAHHDDDDEDDDDINASSVAAVAATTDDVVKAALLESHNNNNNNKWSKNGFGAQVVQQSGKFSREESDQVRKAIEDYCSAKKIKAARLCSENEHKAELKGAWMEIAKSLPHRSVQSVYRHGIRQLHPFKRGGWTKEEVDVLMDLVQKLGKKWSLIQAKLQRSADACRDKYREMSDEYVKGRWKEDETEELKRIIREYLHVAADVDMKVLGKMVEDKNIQISWNVISKKMIKRSRLSCFKKWQKMTGISSSSMEDDDLDNRKKAVKISKHKSSKRARKKAASDSEDSDDDGDTDPNKRLRLSSDQDITTTVVAVSAAAAAAVSTTNVLVQSEYDELYSAKMADATVEAVGLPDTSLLEV